MKINFGRIFEQSLIPDQQREPLMPFIEWVQQAIDNISRALTSSLTLGDNLDAEVLTQSVKSTATTAAVEFKTRKTPIALIIAQTTPATPQVAGYSWEVLTNGNVRANFTFTAAPTTGVSVRFVAFFS
jgi:hypothetical protein